MKIRVEFELAVDPDEIGVAVGVAVKQAVKEAQGDIGGSAQVRRRVGDNVVAVVTVEP